jgi:hypothetical protein
MKTVVIAVALLAGTASGALADPEVQGPPAPAPNPYAACIAEAGPIFGSVMTIEQLRQYMAEHPVCTGAAPASEFRLRSTDDLPVPAVALSGHNLFIDLEKWANKEIYLTNVRVHGTDNGGAIANAGGVTFKISPRGIDPETFRKFLKHCNIRNWGNPVCDGLNLTVTPTGEKVVSNWPLLINVRLGH